MSSHFHFIRPWWFLAAAPLALLIWAILKRQDSGPKWHGIVAPHLLPFLLKGRESRRALPPILLVAAGWIITVAAVAGPAWRREPAPFAEDTAALTIVMRISPSMLTEDVQPNRLARGVQKVHDLLALRQGAKSALIAYGGTAHVVMPPTTDAGIINSFAQALDPKIMPSDGDAAVQALRAADHALVEAGGGSILWITDSIAPEQAAELAAWRKQSSTAVRILPPLLPGEELQALSKSANRVDAILVHLTADATDVSKLARAAKFAPTTSATSSDRWEESGYWLTPILALITLVFFRKGWMAEIAANA